MVEVCAFDLDGTVIDGESPLKLTTSLVRHRQMPILTSLQMAMWGIRYRLRLPQVESTPRELLFSVLTGPSVAEVDSEISEIFERRIRKRIRPGAVMEVARCKAEGMRCILASASFKPITTAIVEALELDGQVSTVMEERDGHYTGKVSGQPVQGDEKARRLIEFCDDRYGEGGWKIVHAYSDHYSDIPLLELAERPAVVDPDGLLSRTARRRGWPELDWDASPKE